MLKIFFRDFSQYKMSFSTIRSTKYLSAIRNIVPKFYSTKQNENKSSNKFETVFSFPTVRYIALINRLKVYHLIGTSIAIPSSAILEMMNILPSQSFLSTMYIGVTGAAVLSLTTLPFKNVIGHLYISEDNTEIKIASVDFWGRRIDKIVNVDDWIPLLEMKPNTMDALYLTPQLTDGTTYKLPVKFGKVLNAQKMGQVLE